MVHFIVWLLALVFVLALGPDPQRFDLAGLDDRSSPGPSEA